MFSPPLKLLFSAEDWILPPTINPILLYYLKILIGIFVILPLRDFFHIKQAKKVSFPDVHPTDPDSSTLSSISFDFDTDVIDTLECLSIEDGSFSLFTQHLSTSPPIVHSSFRPKYAFYPSHAKGPYLESFYRVVYADFLKLCRSSSSTSPNNHNLSSSEVKSLDALTNTADINIKSADKGGGIVLQKIFTKFFIFIIYRKSIRINNPLQADW